MRLFYFFFGGIWQHISTAPVNILSQSREVIDLLNPYLLFHNRTAYACLPAIVLLTLYVVLTQIQTKIHRCTHTRTHLWRRNTRMLTEQKVKPIRFIEC